MASNQGVYLPLTVIYHLCTTSSHNAYTHTQILGLSCLAFWTVMVSIVSSHKDNKSHKFSYKNIPKRSKSGVDINFLLNDVKSSAYRTLTLATSTHFKSDDFFCRFGWKKLIIANLAPKIRMRKKAGQHNNFLLNVI